MTVNTINYSRILFAVTTDAMNRSVVSIHRVKLSETKAKGQQEGYRKNKTWRLKELKVVDGKDEHQVNKLCSGC